MVPGLSELLNTDSFTVERSGLQTAAAHAWGRDPAQGEVS
jgi:hypothetical protein